MNKILIYLDWNILDKIEKIDSLDDTEKICYQAILDWIKDNNAQVPYTDAHISDLMRGHNNTNEHIPEHLQTISRITNNLCLIQYANNEDVSLFQKNVIEFFQESVAENTDESMPESAEEILSFINNLSPEEMEGIDTHAIKSIKEYFDSHMNQETIAMLESNPIFSLMFPSASKNPSPEAMFNDMLSLSNKMERPKGVYNQLKQSIVGGIQKVQSKKIKNILPKGFNINESLRKHMPHIETTKNPWFDKITNEYALVNFKGYKSDEKFANMLDDSKHVFYGAYCKYFITLDDKCHYKANEVYKKLNIGTKALKPCEFKDHLISIETGNYNK